jgi:hypothetical protein
MKTTNQACPESISPTLELEKSELYLNDYDEALCLVLEAVETLPVSQHNLGDVTFFDDRDDDLCCTAVDMVERMEVPDDCKLTVLDSSPVKKNGVSLLQNILEKTPDHLITPYQGAGDMTRRVEIPRRIQGNRSCLNGSRQVRRRLSYSSKKTPQNAARRFRLDDVYRFLLKKDPVNSHCAETDALNLLECIVKVGQSFTDWVDENAVQFNSIKKMG